MNGITLREFQERSATIMQPGRQRQEFVGECNIQPPVCLRCGRRHEPEYPHVMTRKFARYIQVKERRAPTLYDTVRHTEGLIREASMTSLLSSIPMEVK